MNRAALMIQSSMSQSISDLGDDYANTDLLKCHQLYETRDPRIVGHYILEAEIEAENAINKIVEISVDMIYSKYLDSKLMHHTIAATANLAEMLVTTEYIL